MKNKIKDFFHSKKAILAFILIAYFLIASLTSFAYDESFYYQYFNWNYLYSVQPYYLWVFGLFYNIINIGSLTINLPFYLLGFENVIIQQFLVKLPLILATLVTAIALEKILTGLKPAKIFEHRPLYLFLVLPIVIFDVALFGNPLIIAVMFLVLSVYFLTISNTKLSAVFLGVSAATYLYPIFFFLPFLKVVSHKSGKKRYLPEFIIFSAVFAIGQLIPVFISILTSSPITSTVIAPFLGIKSSITITSGQPSIYGPFYFISYLFKYNSPAIIMEIVYLVAMLVPMLIFLFKIKKPSIENFVDFLFIDSLMFVIFSITETPQYLLAVAPFMMLLYYLTEKRSYIHILTLATLVDVLLFFSNKPTLYFFSNLNPSLANSYYYFNISASMAAFLSIIYFVVLLSALLFYFEKEESRLALLFPKKISIIKLKNKSLPRINNITERGIIILSIVLVIVLIIGIPLTRDAPKNMYFTSQASSECTSSNIAHMKNNELIYYLNFTDSYNLLNSYTRNHSNYQLSLPDYQLNKKDFKYHQVIFPDSLNNNFSVLVNSTANPIIVGEPVTFLTKVYNANSTLNYTWYGGGNSKNRSETSIFYSPGNWSVKVVVTELNGEKTCSNFTELVKDDIYGTFNSKSFGGYISDDSMDFHINSSYVRTYNKIIIIGNLNENQTLVLNFQMPLEVPGIIILSHPYYIIYGVSSLLISAESYIYILNKIRKPAR